jgi:hypothetical protein
MHRLRVLGLLCMAMFAFAAASAASASAALPEALGTFPTTFTGTSGKGALETSSGLAIQCKKGKNSGSITGAKTGTFTIDFEECTGPIGEKCNSLGDAEGIILVTGASDLVTIKKGDAGLVLLLKPEVHVICHTFLGEVLILVRGDIITLVTPINKKTTKFELNIKGEKGKQEFTECETGEPCGKKITLESSTNGGAFEQSSNSSAENKLTTAKELEIMA